MNLPPRAARILDELCADSFTTPEEVLSDSRSDNVVSARRRLVRCLRAEGLSLPVIGRMIGRDHATVLYLLRTDDPVRRRKVSA